MLETTIMHRPTSCSNPSSNCSLSSPKFPSALYCRFPLDHSLADDRSQTLCFTPYQAKNLSIRWFVPPSFIKALGVLNRTKMVLKFLKSNIFAWDLFPYPTRTRTYWLQQTIYRSGLRLLQKWCSSSAHIRMQWCLVVINEENKPRLIHWVLLHKKFNLDIKDRKLAELEHYFCTISWDRFPDPTRTRTNQLQRTMSRSRLRLLQKGCSSSTHFLSLISKSNLWSSKIQYINLGLLSFLITKYILVSWSVKTITLDPIKYDLNLSAAKTRTSNSFLVVVQFSCASFNVILAQQIV